MTPLRGCRVVTAIFGTANVPFDTEAEARAFLLMQGFVQIRIPRGRLFMHMTRNTSVEIAQVRESGWAVNRIDPPQESQRC